MPTMPALVWWGALGAVLSASVACEGERIRLGDLALPSSADLGEAPMGGGNSGGTTSEAAGGAGAGGTLPELPGAGAPGMDGGADCIPSSIAADEVVWIGDSWFTIPGIQRTGVEDLARAAGAIGPDEQYLSLAAPAATLAAVVEQYRSRQAETPELKLLIMDGGTWDTIIADDSQATVPQVVRTFELFLEEVAGGSVEQIIYMLMPELQRIVGVAQLRPGLQAACASSVVPCHFLDLQPLWEGHEDYTAPDGIQASDAGALVIAEGIWGLMQAYCIPQ